jgi:branched-chain amino acid transport system substrate-binding protein
MHDRACKYSNSFRGLRLGLATILLVSAMLLVSCAQATPQPAQTEAPAQPAAETEAAAPETTEVQPAPAETSAPAESKVVKIGVLAPLTGQAAADGEEMVRGAQLAVKEINEKGGVAGYTFEVVSGDTKDQTPDAVTSAINRLMVDPDVDVMVTGYASNTNFEITIMADNQMPYLLSGQSAQTRDIISPSPDDFPTVWSVTPSYDGYNTEPPRLFELWASEGKMELKNRTVAMVTSDNAYSKTISDGLKETFTKLGWTITVDEMVPFQEVLDWRTILAKVRENPPDVIINTDYMPANSAAFLNQFLEDPTNSYVFLQYAPSVPEFLELTGEGANGVMYDLLAGVVRSSKNAEGLEYIEKFKKEYGVDTGPYGLTLYSSVYMYAAALEKVGDPNDRLAIGKAIGELEYPTPAGTIKFDPATHLAMQSDDYVPLQFYQIWEGERILLNPPAYAEGTIQTPPWFK